MHVTIPFDKKDDIGNKLNDVGFTAQAKYFLEKHYGASNNKISVNVKTDVSEDFLTALLSISEQLEIRGLTTQIKQTLLLIQDPSKEPVKSVKSFENGVTNYIQENAIKGWLFKLDSTDNYVPYAVNSISFTPADQRNGTESHVTIVLVANSPQSKGTRSTTHFNFNGSDILRRTIPEILSLKGLYKENQQLVDDYYTTADLYLKYQPQFGKQFTGKGQVTDTGGYRELKIKLDGDKRIRMVNDDNDINDRRVFQTYTTPYFWEGRNITEGTFEEMPFHPYIKMFDLNNHVHYWVLAHQLHEYVYNTKMGDKLILPDAQRDLIDILVSDLDVIMDDVVEGKSGGTTVLGLGEPGLGKTLTAEIYSEVVQRPLYRVHSGQLGTNPDKIEAKLEEILDRSERWGSICLIDEADTYIRRRDNSVDHNAIVAAFLRKLEYFSGFLFMTSNRVDDIDDAIKSRCMAIIKYEYPTKENAKKIWQVLSTQFKLPLENDIIDQLIAEYPKCSGRDIKELLKLSAKYYNVKNKPLDMETFRHCAVFRGLTLR